MQVDRARNCFLDLHGKFSLSLSEILKKVVWPHWLNPIFIVVVSFVLDF